MPENDKKKKKQEYTAHERRMYNAYVKKALRSGEDAEEMNTWIAKRRKKGEK